MVILILDCQGPIRPSQDIFTTTAPLTTRSELLTIGKFRGRLVPPLTEETVSRNVARIGAAHGDRNPVLSRHQGRRLTSHELDLSSNVLARGLKSLGITKGNRV